jgi:hypothetical protein
MSELRELVTEELSTPVDPRVTAVAEAIAAAHGKASRAVLFYGSCLREKQLDGLMLDFYLIVSDYRTAYDKRWLVAANRLIPPNVFYFEEGGLAAKYAVLSEADFHRLNGPETSSVSVWARFAQPSRLAWAKNAAARKRAIDAVSRAAPTLLWAAGQRDGEDVLDWWRRAFALTYSAELRANLVGRRLRYSTMRTTPPTRTPVALINPGTNMPMAESGKIAAAPAAIITTRNTGPISRWKKPTIPTVAMYTPRKAVTAS